MPETKKGLVPIYLPLTEEQVSRGVVFSSTFSKSRKETGNLVHEIFKDDSDIESKIEKLKNDSLYVNSPWTYNILRR